MFPRAQVALLALALLVSAGPAAASVGPVTGNPGQVTGGVTADDGHTSMRIRLRPDGDAHWTVRMNFSIKSSASETAFRTLAADFEDGGSLGQLTAFRNAADQASAETGRPMAIRNVTRRSVVRNVTGQLLLEFTWTNFTRRSGSTVYVDDVFRIADGTWLQSLRADQSLVVTPPPEYRLLSASPAGYQVSSASLRWTGPRTFEPGELQVAYESPGPGEEPPDENTLWPVVGVLVLLFGGGLAYFIATRDLPFAVPAILAGDGDESATTAPDPDAPSSPADADASPAADEETAAAADEVDEELLSDEERIERLLDRNGGRMKQANIVTETGWSNAKVSQLLSSMDEAGRIDKLRLGRENLISFPDEDVRETDGEDA